jgi:hypothetical protein
MKCRMTICDLQRDLTTWVTLLGVSIVALLAACPVAAGAEKGKGDDAPGYDDTPLLPNSPWRVHDRKRPQPVLVAPGSVGLCPQAATPPADAVVLFNGKDLSQWTGGNEKGIEDGCINILKTGELRSKKQFGDCQLHVEWATPAKADGGNMQWGNSGVLFFGLFEVQIIESHDSHIYADGNAGAIYGQYPALVNPTRKPGEWQSFDIVFTAPHFDGTKLAQPAYLTVFYNGVLVQYHRAVMGNVAHRQLPAYNTPISEGPIVLQQHGSAVRFRNLWVRPLKLDD